MSNKIIALIVAGGSGERFGSAIPKQYNFSILTKTVKKFLSCELIDNVKVVIRPEDLKLYNQAIEGLNLLPVAFGGKTRGESVKNGLESIKETGFVLVHDACRPYVSVNLINKVIQELKNNPDHGVVPVLKITEAVKRIEDDKVDLVDRSNLFAIQTPQGFSYEALLYCYRKTKEFYYD
ncbi:MAG: IspD/TarI family cytidylyltransferase, partial [Pseudomonadota bacterium]